MNLDDLVYFKKLDTLNMLAEIDGLPDQLQQAWDLGSTQPLPKLAGELCEGFHTHPFNSSR
jgi:hypothetical protein